jgi:hypothetical protein
MGRQADGQTDRWADRQVGRLKNGGIFKGTMTLCIVTLSVTTFSIINCNFHSALWHSYWVLLWQELQVSSLCWVSLCWVSLEMSWHRDQSIVCFPTCLGLSCRSTARSSSTQKNRFWKFPKKFEESSKKPICHNFYAGLSPFREREGLRFGVNPIKQLQVRTWLEFT